MKKVLALLLVCCMMVTLFTACSGKKSVDIGSDQLVNGKFAETKHIKVEVYDRGNVDVDNMWSQYIKKGMLETYNVDVEFVAVPRWTEKDVLNNLLASQEAPDICYTYDMPTIQQYASMGGVLDLQAYVADENKALFPDLWNWLGDYNMLYDKDPKTGTVWCIEGKRNNTYRANTFIRQDWLKKLNLAVPTNVDEFEKCLIAFRDNAQVLLGADASKMVPFSISYDVGWRSSTLIESFLDPDVTDKEFYINGFDERMFTQNGTKNAIKLLNKWYNDGLIWKDFPLYPSGDSTEDDMLKAGFVGAFIHNYDYPFRDGKNGINGNLMSANGSDSVFVAIDCFKDSKGNNTKYAYSSAGDRKIFFPATNTEPLACMLYLNYISKQDVIEYIQTGVEGINHKILADGAVQILDVSDDNVAYKPVAIQNIDLTMTCNGLRLATDELTIKSLSYGYDPTDPAIITKAMECSAHDAKSPKNVNVGTIKEETEFGAGLSDLRDAAYDKAVTCSVADFDKVWDEGMKSYLAAGGQKIMDAREKAWKDNFGSSKNIK